MTYEYKAVWSKTTEVKLSEVKSGVAGGKIAARLELELNELAKQGWEFDHVDETSVTVKPSFFARLCGEKETTSMLKVFVWRREI